MRLAIVSAALAIFAATAPAAVVVERWGVSGHVQHPGTLSYDGSLMKFDLSALPAESRKNPGTGIHHARPRHAAFYLVLAIRCGIKRGYYNTCTFTQPKEPAMTRYAPLLLIWLLGSMASAAEPGQTPREISNSLDMSFVVAPAADGQNSIYLGKTEVTLGQFRRYQPDHSNGPAGKAGAREHQDLPVVRVSPAQARAFCKWLGEQDGGEYRLPTEQEWEKACRAGGKGKYFFGDDRFALGDYAWYDDNAAGLGVRGEDKGARLVGQKLPNAVGLFDMLGNVWEWCESSAAVVARGGAWDTPAPDCDCLATRKPDPQALGAPERGDGRTGFRVVMVKPPKGPPSGPGRWLQVGQQAVQELLKSPRAGEVLADKAAVVVVPLSSEGKGTTQLGMLLASGMEAALLQSGRLRVADRRTLDQVLKEKDMALAFAQEHVAELGKALSADALLTGSLTLAGDQVVGEVRLVGTKKAEVLATTTFRLPADQEVRSCLLYVQRPAQKEKQQGDLPPLSLYYDVLAQRPAQDGKFEEVVVREGSSLRSGDQYRIRVHAASDCYLYVITYDSQNDVYVLFPHAQIKQGNYIRGGCTYTIPGDNDPWYTLDANPGKESIVLVASYAPLKDLEGLLATVKTALAAEKDKAGAIRDEVAKLARTRGAEDCVVDGFKISNSRGTVLARPKADYVLNGGRNVENLMRLAEGTDRVVQMTTFNHER